jgi:hypothetical protein
MNQTIAVNKDLVIELLPSSGDDGEPALCLHTRGEPGQSLIVFLSEVYLLRDALATAGTRLAKIKAAGVRNNKRSLVRQTGSTRPLCPHNQEKNIGA